MKPYDELTLEEKQEMLREGIRKWKSGDPMYSMFDDIYVVTQFILLEYTRKCNKLPMYITPPLHQGPDIIHVLLNLPEFDEISRTENCKN